MPRPRRIGWQLLGFAHPSGHLGADAGAALERTCTAPMLADVEYTVVVVETALWWEMGERWI